MKAIMIVVSSWVSFCHGDADEILLVRTKIYLHLVSAHAYRLRIINIFVTVTFKAFKFINILLVVFYIILEIRGRLSCERSKWGLIDL